MSRIDDVISRAGGRWFTPRRRTDELAGEVAALSAANHELTTELTSTRAELSDLSESDADLCRRVAELEDLLAAQTDQLRRAIEDLVTRSTARPGGV